MAENLKTVPIDTVKEGKEAFKSNAGANPVQRSKVIIQ